MSAPARGNFPFGIDQPSKPWKHSIVLPIDAARIAARQETLQLAELWPKEPIVQQLLAIVIELAAEVQTGAILTVPTAIALTDCAMRMAGHFIARGDMADLAVDNTIFFAHMRQLTLKRFIQGGWKAASTIPRLVVEYWVQLARSKQDNIFSVLTIPDWEVAKKFDSETEQCVCGAIVSEWIRMLLRNICQRARIFGSPLLSLGMLNPAPGKSGELIASNFFMLGCSQTPNLDVYELNHFSLPLHLQRQHRCDFASSEWFKQSLPRWIAGASEDIATLKILGTENWYNNHHSIRLVAEQFARGTRRSHISDLILQQLKMRPLLIESLIPKELRGQVEHRGSAPFKDLARLYIAVMDAADHEWIFLLEFNGEYGQLIDPQSEPDSTVYIIQHDRRTTTAAPGFKIPKFVSEIQKKFEPHLNEERKQLLRKWKDHPEQLAQMLKSPMEANQNSSLPPKLNLQFVSPSDDEANGRSSSSAAADEIFRNLLDNSNESSKAIWREIKAYWCQQDFNQIAIEAFPLLDFDRWTSSRYSCALPSEARRIFQFHLIDASMQASGMKLLPAEIMSIINDYHTIETLPYIPPDEHQFLASSQSF